MEEDLQIFCNTAIEKGAQEAKVVSPQSVVTAAWVRKKCQFGCGGYGKCLTCPPYSPSPEVTAQMLKEYSSAILIKTHALESGGRIRDIVAEMEKEIFLRGYYKAFVFGSGPCKLCPKCNTERPCEYPNRARPSMEAAGIDVFSTARNNGFIIKVLASREEVPSYFGLLLID